MKAIDKVYISSVFGLASTLAQTKEPQDELDANREAMLQNAGKMEVGTYEPIDNIKTAFEDLGKSLKAVSIRLGDLDIKTPKTNTKWYNKFKNKRRKR